MKIKIYIIIEAYISLFLLAALLAPGYLLLKETLLHAYGRIKILIVFSLTSRKHFYHVIGSANGYKK